MSATANETKKPEPKKLSGAIAIQSAIKNNIALEYKSQMAVPVALLIASENPRIEPANLYRQGIKLIDTKDVKNSMIHMALSDDFADVERLVKMVEEFENDALNNPELSEGDTLSDDLSNMKIADDTDKGFQQSIVSLSRSLAITQLQPAGVRKKGDKYTLIFGQRRLAGILYRHALTRLWNKEDKKKPIFPAILMCVESADVTKEQAFDLAVQENRQRKDFTPLQWSAIIHEYLKRKNPTTKKPYTLKDVVGTVGLPYGITRNRWALLLPRSEEEVDDDGTVTKAARGLTDEDREKLERGDITLTSATRKALGEKFSKKGDVTPPRQTTRLKSIPLKDMQQLFDDTSESNIERRKAISECMGLPLDKAIDESNSRIQTEELGTGKKKRGKKKGSTAPAEAVIEPVADTEVTEPVTEEATGPGGEVILATE